MFERKFEFIVHHPLEICEQRVLDMEKSGCFSPKISTDVLSTRHDGYSEIYVGYKWIRRGNRMYIEAVIKQIDDGTSHISGIAILKGIETSIYFIVTVSCFFGITLLFLRGWGEWREAIFVTVFFSLGAVYQAIQVIFYRNRLIKTLEQALTQPKKKKNEVV